MDLSFILLLVLGQAALLFLITTIVFFLLYRRTKRHNSDLLTKTQIALNEAAKLAQGNQQESSDGANAKRVKALEQKIKELQAGGSANGQHSSEQITALTDTITNQNEVLNERIAGLEDLLRGQLNSEPVAVEEVAEPERPEEVTEESGRLLV